MPTLDIFNDDAFSLRSMVASINKLPVTPGRIGAMGLFTAKGVSTTLVQVEVKKGKLAVLPTQPWRAPANPAPNEKRVLRAFTIPHIPEDDAVWAADVQNVRAMPEPGQTDQDAQLAAVATLVNDRLQSCRNNHETTAEYHRIGALSGKVLDADGSTVIYDYYTEFGVTEKVIAMTLSNTATVVRTKCTEIVRWIEKKIGAAPYQRIHALCGSDFFDALIDHANVRAAYENWTAAEQLTQDKRRGFVYGGILWEEYNAQIGSLNFLAADTARVFPVGVRDMFQVLYAPADFIETVNTIGVPFYAKQQRMKYDRGVEIHTQSNPLHLCTYPEALVKLTQ